MTDPTLSKKQISRDNYLRSLAFRPTDALRKWRRLRTGEDTVVLYYMAVRFGQEFAKRFHQATLHPNRVQNITVVANLPPYTPQWLTSRGYKFGGTTVGTDVMVWVNPSGDEFWLLPASKVRPQDAQLEEDPAVAEARHYADVSTAQWNQILRLFESARSNIGSTSYPALYRQFFDELKKWNDDLMWLRKYGIPSLREEVVEKRDLEAIDKEAKRLDDLEERRMKAMPVIGPGLPPPSSNQGK